MPLESFYGGKQGVAPVIKKSYQSIDEMRNASDIRYGEMCLIDTVSKNDKDNGKLFRRIFGTGSGPNAVQGYEYIGQIVGPTSAPPTIEIRESIEKLKKEIKTDSSGTYPIKKYNFRNENNEEQTGVDGSPDNSLLVSNFEISTSTESDEIGGLVSGADHHSIKYSWVNVELTQADGTFSTKALLGFEIPYPEFTTTIGALPFNQAPTVAISHNNIDGPNTPNPFYHNIAFRVPVGIPGCRVSNIKIKNTNDCCFESTTNSGDKTLVYFYDSINVDSDPEKLSYVFNSKSPTKLELSIREHLFDDPSFCTIVKQNQKILVYDLTYQNKLNSNKILEETRTCFLDFYYGVESISLEKANNNNLSPSELEKLSPSELKINYSSENSKHSKTETLGSLLYVDKLQLDETTRLVSYKLANELNATHELGYLKSIEQVTINNAGYLLVLYSSSKDREPQVPVSSSSQPYTITESMLQIHGVSPTTIPDFPENISTSFLDIHGNRWEYQVPENAEYTLSDTFKENNNNIKPEYLLWRNLGRVRVDNYREGLKVASMFDWSYYPEPKDYTELANTPAKMCNILNAKEWTAGSNKELNPYYYGNCTPSMFTDETGQLIIEKDRGDTERVLICPIYKKVTNENGETETKFEYWGFFYNRNAIVEQNNNTSKQGEWIAIGPWNLSLSDSDTTNIGLISTNENATDNVIQELYNSKDFDWGFTFLANTVINENSQLNKNIFSYFWK